MDDLIDLLRERHQGSLVALELPDEDRLVEIEEQLLISLPGEYKEFLLTTGDILCGSLEPATVMDDYAHNFLPELAAQALCFSVQSACRWRQLFWCDPR